MSNGQVFRLQRSKSNLDCYNTGMNIALDARLIYYRRYSGIVAKPDGL